MDKQTEGAKFTDPPEPVGQTAQLPVSSGGVEDGAEGEEEEGGAAGEEDGAGGEEDEGDGDGDGEEEGGAVAAAAGAAAFLICPSCHLPAKACRSDSRLSRSCPLTVRL